MRYGQSLSPVSRALVSYTAASPSTEVLGYSHSSAIADANTYDIDNIALTMPR